MQERLANMSPLEIECLFIDAEEIGFMPACPCQNEQVNFMQEWEQGGETYTFISMACGCDIVQLFDDYVIDPCEDHTATALGVKHG